jgi:hypothetical protein
MDMAEERLSKRSELEDMDMTVNHKEVDMDTTEEHLSKWSGVAAMDAEWVERMHEGMVVAKHHSDNGVETNWRTHQD